MEDDNISELPQLASKSEFDKGSLSLEFFRLVGNSRAKEMKGGYYNTKFDKQGNPHRVYVEDTRRIFISSMDSLIAILTPEIFRNDRAKEIMIKFKEEKEKLFIKYCYKERIRVENPMTQGGEWKYTGKSFMPTIDAELPTENKIASDSARFDMEKGIWNNYVNAYYDELIDLYTAVYADLFLLIDSKDVKYWKSKSGF